MTHHQNVCLYHLSLITSKLFGFNFVFTLHLLRPACPKLFLVIYINFLLFYFASCILSACLINEYNTIQYHTLLIDF